MKCILLAAFGLTLIASISLAAGKAELKNEAERINYSVGYQIGGDFKAQGVEISPEILVQGIQDALKGNEPLLPRDQMSTTLINLKKKIMADQQGREKDASAENRRASAAFLANNAKLKGVTTLPSGVQYKVIKEGSGRKPTLKDDVRVHYRITRIDGSEIGSTYTGGKPRTYPLAQAIPALQEVLPLMAEGSKWQVVLPGSTATAGRDPLEDMGALIYELELLSVLPAKSAKGALE